MSVDTFNKGGAEVGGGSHASASLRSSDPALWTGELAHWSKRQEEHGGFGPGTVDQLFTLWRIFERAEE